MRKLVFIFCLLSFVFGNINAQLGVSFTGGNVDANANVQVDVTVSNFNNLFGFQYSINYDSSVLRFASITNVTTLIDGFDIGAVGTPIGSTSIDPGELTVSWFRSEPATAPNNTRLFTIVFTAIGAPCDSSNIVGANNPLVAEAYDINFNNIGCSFTNNKVKINGSNCNNNGGGGNNNLTITIPNRVVQPNTEVCIPLTVKNFNRFNAGQGKLSWNPAVLSFVRIQNKVGQGSFSDNTNFTGTGLYTFVWENSLDPSNPISLPDGTVFFEMCFNVVGTNGSMTVLDMTSFASDWGFTDENGQEPPLNLVNGKVTVSTAPELPVVLKIGNTTVNNGSKSCVSITVDTFTNINSFQGTFSWNGAVLKYANVEGFGAIPSFSANDFNNALNPNRLRVTWNAPSGNQVTLANGTEIFKICFEAAQPCNATTSLVDFIDVTGGNNFNREFTRLVGGSVIEIPYLIRSGMATVNCGSAGACSVTSKSNVTCNGGTNGGIVVNVTYPANCQCIWYKDGSTTPFATTTSPNCNLVNATAGTYKLDVVCGGVVECTLTETITQPQAITINGATTNIGCNTTTGGITLTVTGGTPNYTYKWDDAAGSITKDITNLPVGNYTVIVTDNNGCISSRAFPITEGVAPLDFTFTQTNIACFGGSTGAIVVNPTGGCPNASNQYKITPATLTGLTAGSYSVVVEDFSNPASMVTKTVVIAQPASALVVAGTATASSGNNGTITLTISGGTPAYNTVWTGGIEPGTTNPTNLAPGPYTVTVTDANGCPASATITVPNVSGSVDFGSVSVDNASCFGIEDGAVLGSIISGNAPFKIDLIQGAAVAKTVNIAAVGPFMINNVKAGTYTLRVTDSANNTGTRTVAIGEPSKITLTADEQCADGSTANGSISLVVSGGAGSYLYEWSTGARTQNLSNLNIGSYSVVVEDAEGCQAILNNIRVQDCNPSNCYEASPIITPNGDGVNDEFVINCVMQEQSKLTIYNRWGERVFTQQNYNNTWTGQNLSGDQLKEGGYMWVLEVDFANGRREVFKGTVTMLTQE